MKQITITKSRAFGGRKQIFAASMDGHQIASGESTREDAMSVAMQTLLGAWHCSTAPIYANAASDGAILTTREYAPGNVESSWHRKSDGRGSGICMSRCEINGQACTVAEYHAHYLAMYNGNV